MAQKPDPTPAPGADQPQEAPPRRRRGLLFGIVGALLVLLLGGGGAAYYLLVLGKARTPKAEAAAPRGPEHMFKVGTIVVNVARTDGRRYLRTTVELGATEKAAKHLEKFRALAVDTAIGVLAAKPLEVLLDPGQRDALRDELRGQLNHALGDHAITHLYLTEFLVQ